MAFPHAVKVLHLCYALIPVLLNVSKQDSKYLFSVQVDFWPPGKARCHLENDKNRNSPTSLSQILNVLLDIMAYF